MSNILFPHLYGLSWQMKKTISTGTVIQPADAPGYETRVSRGPDPIPKFSLQYRVLDDGAGRDSLNTLEGFFRDRLGAFDSFLLKLDDVVGVARASVTDQALTPDGSGNAPFVRALGSSNSLETVFELAGVNGNPGTAPVVKMGGSPLTDPTDYTIEGPGVAVSGTTYPGMVAVISAAITDDITADFTWYYRVRFEQDDQEFDLFHYLLWEAQQVKLVGVRA